MIRRTLSTWCFDMKGQTRKNILRTLAFVLALAAALWVLSVPFTVDTPTSKRIVQGALNQPEDSLQAVYIGNSGVYRFWQPAVAWDSDGIAVMNLATASMPGVATQYLMEETLKSQDVDMFIVDLRAYTDSELNEANLHNIIDFLPLDFTRLRLVTRLCLYQRYWPYEALEYYFPVLRFHARWNELESEDFRLVEDDGTKGSYYADGFLRNVQDEQDRFAVSETRTQPQKRAVRAFEQLMDWCEENDVTVLFVAAPLLEHTNQKERLNWFADMARERGFGVVNFNERAVYDDVGLELSDFMDNTHTNVFGSIKFTHYLANYLVENYGLADLRGTQGYEDWDAAVEIYRDKIGKKASDAMDEE